MATPFPFAAVFFLISCGAMAAETPLSVSGLVVHPLHLTRDDLKSFPTVHISTTQASGKGPVALDCIGAAVTALLDKASLNIGRDKNANLAHSLVVTADDGYTVVLSLGEIDPDYGNAAPIIAFDCGGKPLDTPRLVMPNDKLAGRAVKGVVSIVVR